jgi:hypothetical protein
MNELTDTSSRVLEVGQIVAYNCEGNVCKGRIKALKTRKQYGKERPLIEVELLSDFFGGWHPRGHISKVTSPSNLLVIDQSA